MGIEINSRGNSATDRNRYDDPRDKEYEIRLIKEREEALRDRTIERENQARRPQEPAPRGIKTSS